MTTIRTTVLILLSTLAACASIEGTYEPACIAYEGDRVILRDDRFEWQRFTDERNVDENGTLIDPFPDYPKLGSYTVDDARVRLNADNGVHLDDWYLLEHQGDIYLLTYEQNEVFLNNEGLATCALKRSTDNS